MTTSDDALGLFEEFKAACKSEPHNIVPRREAQEDAEKFYKLKTKKQLLDFIANDGLSNIRYEDFGEWRNNTTNEKPLYAFGYLGITNTKQCYIAIIKSEKTGKWLIKSFHPPKRNPIPTMEGLLKAVGLKSSED